MSISDAFQREAEIDRLAEYAASLGFRRFKTMLKTYEQELRVQSQTIYANNITNFTGQPLELDSGSWVADDLGIFRDNGQFQEVACCHPILPTERLINIDTGVEKLTLAYARGKRWRTVTVDKKTLASNTAIVGLANNGIAVNSENAKALIKYLHDIENLNYDIIPEKLSVSRLGYIEGEGFSPYFKGLIFDGEAEFGNMFKLVTQQGDYEVWKSVMNSLRSYSFTARLLITASFASVLVAPLQINPFFVHLWGGTGTGKSVALMAAASVWGYPEIGSLIQTFNSTPVGHERLAAFFNHIPTMIDELQLAKKERGKPDFNVYALAQGSGKTRGNKYGGLDITPTWRNAILTTGETPITALNSGGGAVARVIEIECKTGVKVIEKGNATATLLMRNYGFAGKMFVERLYGDETVVPEAKRLYSDFLEMFQTNTGESTIDDKQAMAAACICVADYYANKWIFQDDENIIGVHEIIEHLATSKSSCIGQRGYDYMVDWVAQNHNRFKNPDLGEIYGTIDYESSHGGDVAYIISTIFRSAAEEAGFNSAALLSWLETEQLILTQNDRKTVVKRIGDSTARCIALKLPRFTEMLP